MSHRKHACRTSVREDQVCVVQLRRAEGASRCRCLSVANVIRNPMHKFRMGMNANSTVIREPGRPDPRRRLDRTWTPGVHPRTKAGTRWAARGSTLGPITVRLGKAAIVDIFASNVFFHGHSGHVLRARTSKPNTVYARTRANQARERRSGVGPWWPCAL